MLLTIASFYLLQICPDYLNPADFMKEHTEFSTVVEFGTSGEGVSEKLTTYLINKRMKR
jgi:hypothetical protein